MILDIHTNSNSWFIINSKNIQRLKRKKFSFWSSYAASDFVTSVAEQFVGQNGLGAGQNGCIRGYSVSGDQTRLKNIFIETPLEVNQPFGHQLQPKPVIKCCNLYRKFSKGFIGHISLKMNHLTTKHQISFITRSNTTRKINIKSWYKEIFSKTWKINVTNINLVN